jgi:hypothetical protein
MTMASANIPVTTRDATTLPRVVRDLARTARIGREITRPGLPPVMEPPTLGDQMPVTKAQGGTMSEFMDQAKKLASEHSEQADQGLDKAAEMAGEKTGGKYDSQIQAGEQKVEDYLGVQDQDNQGNQDNQGQ